MRPCTGSCSGGGVALKPLQHAWHPPCCTPTTRPTAMALPSMKMWKKVAGTESSLNVLYAMPNRSFNSVRMICLCLSTSDSAAASVCEPSTTPVALSQGARVERDDIRDCAAIRVWVSVRPDLADTYVNTKEEPDGRR